MFLIQGAGFARDPIELAVGEFLKGKVTKCFPVFFPRDIRIGDTRQDRMLEDEFVKDEPERPDIGAKINVRITGQLLRTHVTGSAHSLPRDGGVPSPLSGIGNRTGNAKVDDFSLTGIGSDKNVRGLQITVGNAFLMGIGHRFHNLGENTKSFVESGVPGPQIESGSLDEFHDVIRITCGGFPGMIEGGQIGMIEPGEDMHFLEEASALRAQMIRRENLDRDPTKSRGGFLTFIDTPERPFSKKRADLDPPDQLGPVFSGGQKLEPTQGANRT